MERTVVCAFDPDAGDRAPVFLARVVAGMLRARLVVAVVRPGGSAAERLAGMEERGSSRSLGALAASLRREHTELLEIAAPSPASGLHRVLGAERPAFAVVGSAERAGHGRVRLGTTTERLLDGAPCPIAIATRGWVERPFSEISVAVLPSPAGRAALRAAAELARAARVRLRVVLVLSDSPDAQEADELARELAPEGTGRGAGGAAVLQPALTSAALGLDAGAGLDVASDVFVGDPVDTLVRASKRAGLLVLGSRAYGPAEEVHAGGVARRVLAGARCPVVVVPRG